MAGNERGISKSVLACVLSSYKQTKSLSSNYIEIKGLTAILEHMDEYTTDDELYTILTILVESKMPKNSTFDSTPLISPPRLETLKELHAKNGWNREDACCLYYAKESSPQLFFLKTILTSVDLMLCVKEIENRPRYAEFFNFLCDNPNYFKRLTENKWKTYTANDLSYLIHYLYGADLARFIMQYWIDHPAIQTVLQDPLFIHHLLSPLVELGSVQKKLENYSIPDLSRLLTTANAYLRLFNHHQTPAALNKKLSACVMTLLPEILGDEKKFLTFFADQYQVHDLIKRVPQSEPLVTEFLTKNPGIRDALSPTFAPCSDLAKLIEKMDEMYQMDHDLPKLLFEDKKLFEEVRDFAKTVWKNHQDKQVYNKTLFDNAIRYLINRDLSHYQGIKYALYAKESCTRFLFDLSIGRSECSPVDAYIYYDINMNPPFDMSFLSQYDHYGLSIRMQTINGPTMDTNPLYVNAAAIALLKFNSHRTDEIVDAFQTRKFSLFILEEKTLKEIHAAVDPVCFPKVLSCIKIFDKTLKKIIELKDSLDYQPLFKSFAAAMRCALMQGEYQWEHPSVITLVLGDADWQEQMSMVATIVNGEHKGFNISPVIFSPWLNEQVNQTQLKMESLLQEIEALEQLAKAEKQQEEESQLDVALEKKLNEYYACIEHYRNLQTVLRKVCPINDFFAMHQFEMAAKLKLFELIYNIHLPLAPSQQTICAAFYKALPLIFSEEIGFVNFTHLKAEALCNFDRALIASINLTGSHELNVSDRLSCLIFLWANQDKKLPLLNSLQAISAWVKDYLDHIAKPSSVLLFAEQKFSMVFKLLQLHLPPPQPLTSALLTKP